MKLAIVIPTYNEAETIPSLIKELFEKIKQLVEKLDVLIIDDSSPDGTADIVRKLGEKYEKMVSGFGVCQFAGGLWQRQ